MCEINCHLWKRVLFTWWPRDTKSSSLRKNNSPQQTIERQKKQWRKFPRKCLKICLSEDSHLCVGLINRYKMCLEAQLLFVWEVFCIHSIWNPEFNLSIVLARLKWLNLLKTFLFLTVWRLIEKFVNKLIVWITYFCFLRIVKRFAIFQMNLPSCQKRGKMVFPKRIWAKRYWWLQIRPFIESDENIQKD